MAWIGVVWHGLVCHGLVLVHNPVSTSLDTFPDGLGRDGSGQDGYSDNRADSVQLELELGLSLARLYVT